MGYGGILWIWMTMIITIVHLSPVMFDFDHLSEKSPELFEKINSGSDNFIVPGVRTNIGDRFLPHFLLTRSTSSNGLVTLPPTISTGTNYIDLVSKMYL